MVKAQNYYMLLLVLLGLSFLSLRYVPRIEAGFSDWQIPVIQSVSPVCPSLDYSTPFNTNFWTQPPIQPSQPGNDLFCSESSWSNNPILEGLWAANSLKVPSLSIGGENNWWSKGLFSDPPLSYSNPYEYSPISTFSAPINQTISFSINPFNPYGDYNWYTSPSTYAWASPVDHLSLGRTLFLNGQYESAITELKNALNLPSVKEEVCLLLGISYQALGNEYLKEAENYLKQAIGFQLYSPTARLQLASVYYQQGEYSKAIQEYGQVVEQNPNSADAVKGLALSYFKANDLTTALKELQEAEMMDPNDLEILCTMGFVLEEKHLFREARQYYGKVIDLASDSSWASQARDHIQHIELVGDASSIGDLKGQEVAMLIMSAPELEDMPDNALIVLLDEVQYQVLPDDTLINRTHRLFKILDERGKDASEIKMFYDSTFQNIKVDLARVIKPDGTIIGAGMQDIQEISPWAPFYGNFKVLIISMPGVTVGSIIEYQITIEDIPESRMFTPREIDSCFALASTYPVTRARIEVSIPKDREFKSTFIHGEPLEPEVVADGKMKHFTWELSDIPAIITEPMMPSSFDVSPVLLISSIPSWEAVADCLRGPQFQAMILDDEIRARVKQLTQNLSTQKDKARAIFHYVASQIRYVGLEYGKSGWKPHQATDVYKNKYGDCKDKSTLLVSMFREAGINAYPVWTGTGVLSDGRRLQEAIPQFSAFDHVIAVGIIDDQWVWMDSTSETSSFGEIRAGDQDRESLVIFDDGCKFTQIPVVAPEENMDQEIMDVQIAEDSSAMVSSTTTAIGVNAISSRAFFKALDPIYRRQYLETVVTARATGGKLKNFILSDINDLTQPYKLELIYAAPNYIEWANNIGLLKGSVLSVDNTAIIDGRKYPVCLENTSIGESIVHMTLPQNVEVLYLPQPFTLEIPQILYTSEYTLKDRTITYHLCYETRDIYIPFEDYAAYKEFQEKVNNELKRKIIVEKIRK